MKKKYLYPILLLLLFSFCKKYEVNTISGNQPHSDLTITTQAKENYINRLYILLLGRKADSLEFYQSYQLLENAPSSVFNRSQVIEGIMQNSSFYHKLWEDVRNDILDGIDTAYIAHEVIRFQNKLINATDPNVIDYYQMRIDKLMPLLTIANDLQANTINLQDVHIYTVYNNLYDDINMGTENYVVSIFQNFLFRYPLDYELSEASDMVNNRPATLFLQTGQGKAEFIDIFFHHFSYYEGQVSYLFSKYLFRSPTSDELNIYTQKYLSNNSYYAIQIELLASEEYFLN